MKKYIALIFLSVALLSCKKEKPSEGDYIGNFHGHYVSSGVEINTLDTPLKFNEVTDSTIKINDSEIHVLKKRGDSVIGSIRIFDDNYGEAPYIKGICTKKWNKYTISGTYEALGTSYQLINGDFEIKTK